MNSVMKTQIARFQNGHLEYIEDLVVMEQPATIFINREEMVTLLCSPMGFEYLGVGFLVGEGLIKKREDLSSIKVSSDTGLIYLETKNQNEIAKILFGKRMITTGCGKGTSFYHAMDSFQCRKIDSNVCISAGSLKMLMEKFHQSSVIYRTTGGVHGACLSDGKDMLFFHEDIGRHNAVDKVIGEAFLKKYDLNDKILVTSGRISSEILIKAGRVGIPMVLSRSAPTGLSVELAKKLGITLIGFARGNRMNVYSEHHRIKE
ncbi:formate dehydrogenase accessory sulfurtransferase FdhD [Anaerosolibacter sp.]|uniref:formate dehydrogenase accessory sulfurtransferase FdhD n=1 Tax=Anaerosolibacter sp. TaxID=1872527 RepID=UPI0039F0B446